MTQFTPNASRLAIALRTLLALPLLCCGCIMNQPKPVPSYVGTPQIHQPLAASAAPTASDAVWRLDGSQTTYGATQQKSASSCGSGYS